MGRFDDELSLEFAECPAQHIKTIVDVRNERLFLRQFQSSGLQKVTDNFFGFFRDFFGSRRNDKIIGIVHEIHLVGIFEMQIDFTQMVGVETVREDFLHPVQRHVCEYRRNNAALGSTFISREQFISKNEIRFQELFEYRFVHGDMLNKPIMADVVEASLDVTL